MAVSPEAAMIDYGAGKSVKGDVINRGLPKASRVTLSIVTLSTMALLG